MKNRKVFLKRCEKYFGDKSKDFMDLLSDEPRQAFFLNEKKAAKEVILELLDIESEGATLTDKSRYCLSDAIGKSKAYELGLIYPQDIGASMPASFVDTKNVKLAIDLCAAPGGKSVNILNKLSDDAVLIANDVSYKRASVLSSNLERLGLSNVLITSLDPEYYLKDFKGAFDLVILDAPCSGEGMVRKYPEILDEYSIAGIESLAGIQKGLLETAYELLNEGGQLLYSTCTYAFEEDEDQVTSFLERHEEMELIPLPACGDVSKLEGTIKLSPLNGTEGQYMALFKKKGTRTDRNIRYRKTVKNTLAEAFISDELDIEGYYLYSGGEHYYLSLIPLPEIDNGALCYGMHLGHLKGKRFEPDHGLYRSNMLKGKFKHVIELDEREYDIYISGNELRKDVPDGYYQISYKRMSLGFVKASKGALKNKYPKGLRRVV